MHVRITRVRRKNGKVQEYPQLVESYRRKPDGMPMQRVIMGLSHMSPREVDNLRAALAASREGKKVVVATEPSRPVAAKGPAANLCYLDVVLVLEMWRQWELDELFDDLLPTGEASVAPSTVVAALVAQRCIAPRSKLHAERWFPKTALPELLGVCPRSFNNTRVHRVLDGLDQCGLELMGKLPRRYAARDGVFAALFADVTDTWFVGHGPPLAERSKDKVGVVRRKVGIVLLCNEHGYPLRWEVIRGKESDKTSMTRMVESISGLSWVGDTPVVCDRAMGSTAQLRELLGADVRFLTALTSTEIESYTQALPHQVVANFSVKDSLSSKELNQLAAQAGELVEDAGWEKLDDTLYLKDLGTIERRDRAAAGSNDDGANSGQPTGDHAIEAMRKGRQLRQAVAEGRTMRSAAKELGLKDSTASNYRKLATLAEDIQMAVVEARAQGVAINDLIALSKISDLDVQQDAFDELVKEAAARGGKLWRGHKPNKANASQQQPLRVRAVAYFNPVLFVQQRRTANKHLAEIEAFVESLNDRLASPRSQMTKVKILVEINQRLDRYHLVDAFQVTVTKEAEGPTIQSTRYVVELVFDDKQWERRRRYDGFSLLVAHPETKLPAADLCRLYRAKDMVEKDFQTIKSFVKLHPVRHRLDAKVRAHVTICMLALLLERTLQRKLGDRISAAEALEELGSCHLNHYPGEEGSAYMVTQTDKQQDAILRALRLRSLAHNDEIMDRITPRSELQDTPI